VENDPHEEILRPTPRIKIATEIGKFILDYGNSTILTYTDVPEANHVFHTPQDEDIFVRLILTQDVFKKLVKLGFPRYHVPYLVMDDTAHEWWVRYQTQEINDYLDDISKNTPDL